MKNIPAELHLLSYDFILIIELEMGAMIKGISQESSHFIFIQINLAFIVRKFFIINVIYTAVTVRFGFHPQILHKTLADLTALQTPLTLFDNTS